MTPQSETVITLVTQSDLQHDSIREKISNGWPND